MRSVSPPLLTNRHSVPFPAINSGLDVQRLGMGTSLAHRPVIGQRMISGLGGFSRTQALYLYIFNICPLLVR